MKKNTVIEVLGFSALVCAIVVGVGVLAKTVLGDKYDARETIVLSTESTQSYETYELKKTEITEFDKINMNIEYANVEIIPSDGYYLEYSITSRAGEPEYKVQDDKTFAFGEKRKENTWICFDFGYGEDIEQNNYVKLYVPKDKVFENINLGVESGNISTGDIASSELQINAEYGDITMANITGDDIILHLESVNLDMKELTTDSVDVQNEYGNVLIEVADFKQGTFDLQSGNLDLGQTTAGNLTIQNEYGQVDLALKDKLADYTCDFSTEYGSIFVPNQKAVKENEDDDVENYSTSGKKDKSITIQNESGDITVCELQ